MPDAFGTRGEHTRRMLKKARLLTRPTPAITSPARPESAKTASSPRDAPCPKRGRSSAADPRFTFHASRFTHLQNKAGGLFQHPVSQRDAERDIWSVSTGRDWRTKTTSTTRARPFRLAQAPKARATTLAHCMASPPSMRCAIRV